MRVTAINDAGLTVKAYAGTTGVLLAFNVTAAVRAGLLGFALERKPGSSRPEDQNRFLFLQGMLRFPHQGPPNGIPISTEIAPIQKFRWSDYRVFPDTRYAYRIYPVHGTPQAPVLGAPAKVAVRTESVDGGDHGILFNRAAAASQAFSRDFPEVEAELAAAKREHRPHRFTSNNPDPIFRKAFEWLSRGALELLLDFVAKATNSKWALDVAIYEYELPAIVNAVAAAHERGVAVRVLYHAKNSDPQTAENEHALQGLPAAVKRPRKTQRIFHNKFIILSKLTPAGQRVPQAVLAGSMNFTENGVYRQANVLHLVTQAGAVNQYLAAFEFLWANPADVSAARARHSAENAIDPAAALFAGFSPRRGHADLVEFVRTVNAATRDVLFATVFSIHRPLLDALAGLPHDPILRYGIQNSRSAVTGFHADRTAQFSTVAMLNKGLEGWLKESTRGQRGNILIHTKLVVIDFTSDDPTVLCGSHNLSPAASEGNDENYLITRGDTSVADVYGCEVMRLYDHYRFRFAQRPTPPRLSPTDSWTNRYFTAGSLHQADRNRFAGVV